MELRIVVNWAPYPSGTPRALNQREAFQRLTSSAPPWCQVVLATLPGEAAPVAPVRPDGVLPERVVLPRDSFPVTGRHIPFLLDVMGASMTGFGEDGLGGYFNSDIVVTPRWWEAVERVADDIQVVICHRTDVRHLDGDPAQGRKVNQRTCTDGFFLRRRTWDKLRHTIPDFVVAEPWWDTGMIWWAKARKLKTLHLGGHEVLHVVHGRCWHVKSKGATYNSRLGKQAWMSRLKS